MRFELFLFCIFFFNIDHKTITMASASPLQDIEDNFFNCSICLDHYREPKMLPCLHRYCKDCLQSVIKGCHSEFDCPMCKQACTISEDGVEGFKTDFHMKSLLQFIQLQKSFETKEVRECVGCNKKLKVVAYCFKCKDFLCSECYQFHLNNAMVKEHKQHTLDLRNAEAKSLSLEKLASLNEIPRCHDHAANPAQLCCSTCRNLPVCVACTYGKHRDHELHEVGTLAKTARDNLSAKLEALNKYQKKLHELPNTVEQTKETLKRNAAKKRDTVKCQHEQQGMRLKEKIQSNDAKLEKRKRDLENRKKSDCDNVRTEMELEIQRVRERFEKTIRAKEAAYDEQIEEYQMDHDDRADSLFKKLGALDSNEKSWNKIIDTQEEGNESEIQHISELVDQILKRYKSFKASAAAILASKDDWTDSQCLPDVSAASEPLLEEVKIDYPQLESLSDFRMDELPSVDRINVIISEREESVVDVEGIKAKEWWNKSIASSGDGSIVITGRASEDYSYISVINTEGVTVRQGKMKKAEGSTYYPYRHCAPLSGLKFVTVCETNLIGIYDVRNVTYDEKKISDVIPNWPAGRYVTCIATDPMRELIVVGSDSREVYILDEQLSYGRTLTLPDGIERPRALAVHEENLLVCDYATGKTCAVSMEGRNATLVYEFPSPGRGDSRPSSVCTDRNGFIYMIRDDPTTYHRRKLLVQYSQDGQQILAKKIVDGNARCVTTYNSNNEEKLLIITETSGKLYTFGLVTMEG